MKNEEAIEAARLLGQSSAAGDWWRSIRVGGLIRTWIEAKQAAEDLWCSDHRYDAPTKKLMAEAYATAYRETIEGGSVK